MSDISMEDINHKLEDIANMVKAKLGMKEEQNIANVSGLFLCCPDTKT